jgi:hypothetical protein
MARANGKTGVNLPVKRRLACRVLRECANAPPAAADNGARSSEPRRGNGPKRRTKKKPA